MIREPSALHAAAQILRRDLKLAFRRPGEWLQPVAFFLIVTMLFPLALDPELSRLRQLAPGALWVAALLASIVVSLVSWAGSLIVHR